LFSKGILTIPPDEILTYQGASHRHG